MFVHHFFPVIHQLCQAQRKGWSRWWTWKWWCRTVSPGSPTGSHPQHLLAWFSLRWAMGLPYEFQVLIEVQHVMNRWPRGLELRRGRSSWGWVTWRMVELARCPETGVRWWTWWTVLETLGTGSFMLLWWLDLCIIVWGPEIHCQAVSWNLVGSGLAGLLDHLDINCKV